MLKDKIVPGLDIEKGIERFIGDEEVYLQVLRSFAVNTQKIIPSIDSPEKDDLADYEIKIHSLRGSTASICADDLANKAKALEMAAIENDWTYISGNNTSFVTALRELINGLENLFLTVDASCQKQKKDKPDPEALKQLMIACDNYDMDGVDAIMDEMTAFKYESDDGLVDWLHENIELMNFSEIVERLSGL